MKTCRDCGQDKPLEDSSPAKKASDGRTSYCRECLRVRHRGCRDAKNGGVLKRVQSVRASSPDVKWCPLCRQERGRTEFGRNRAAHDGLTAYCKPCHSAKVRESKERNHGSTRDYHLKGRYGLTSADVDRMVGEQGGVRAICREREPKHVDHDHVTKEVRGVLCSCRNQALGNARDRPDVLRAAIDYLERITWTRQQVCPGVYQLTSPRPAAPSRSSSELQHLISSRRG